MKNIFLGSIFILLLLPQVSFGANSTPPVFVSPQVTACNQQLDAESNAFFHKQASDRGIFIKTNPDVMARHDLRFKQGLAISMRKRVGKSADDLPVPADEDPAFLAFQEKQQSDKVAFFTQLAQNKQSCLGATAP